MGPVLWQRYWIRHLRRHGRDLDIDMHAPQRGNDAGIEIRDRVPLGSAVADFYAGVVAALRRMHIDVKVSAMPSEVPDPIPLPEDRTHHTYDAAYVQRFQQVLSIVAIVLKQHRARFRGRTTPVHFFWGTFDLA